MAAHKSEARRFISRRRAFIAAVLICVLSLWGYARWRFRTIGTVAPFVSTGRIANVDVFLRTRSPNDDMLLVGFVGAGDARGIEPNDAAAIPAWPVYRFDPKETSLEPGSSDDWRNSSGEITNRSIFTTAPIDNDIKTCSISIHGTPISTAGAYAIEIGASPDGKFVNVISDNAKRTNGGWWPWSWGGYPRGPYYHEVFERATGKKIGGTYTIKDPGGPLYLSFCWEAKGKYVVYFDEKGKYLWVIPGPNLNARPN